MGKTIHVYAHTHWDKEWYFTASRSHVYLMKDLADVLDTLEMDPDFTAFLLDAQSGLIEDYLKWKPEDASRIERLVSDRRLMIGPWYTQTDQIIISGESVVRNLYHGISVARRLGHSMRVGYVPDAFGQGGNMPQVYREFGIEDVVMMRGVSDDMSPKTTFLWRGNDGSEVMTTQLRTSYSIAMKFPTDPKQADEFWNRVCLEREGTPAATRHVLFPVGFDQCPIRRKLPEMIRERATRDPENEYVFDTLEDYVDAVRRDATTLDTVHGQLLNGKPRRCHRSIWSSRSDLKVLNTWCQNYVVNVAEPILALSHSLGNEYPQGALTEIWKLLFQNAAHDSIGSCVSDAVNGDVRERYKRVSDIATSLVELHMRLIATHVREAQDEHTLTLFNPLPTPKSEVVTAKLYLPNEPVRLVDPNGRTVPFTVLDRRDLTDYVLAQTINLDPSRSFYVPEKVFEATVAIGSKDVPALGYQQLRLEVGGEGSEEMLRELTCLENEFYRIEVNENGTLRVEDKATGFVYDQQAVIVDNGDDGDSFNYSPPCQDLEVRSDAFVPSISIMGSSVYQRATVSLTMVLPEDLTARAEGRCDTPVPLTLTVALRAGSHVIDLTIDIDNRVRSHRMCLLIDAQLATKTNFADEHFGTVERENHFSADWEAYNRTGGQGWNEVPVAIQPTQSFVGLFGEGRGLAALPKGVREYQVVDNEGHEDGRGNIIRLTLFRTYGQMGKADLLYRPGRASGEEIIETPDAQLHGHLSFSLGLIALAGSFDSSGLEQLARAYMSPIQSFQYASFLNGRLMFSEEEVEGTGAPIGSLFELEGTATVSAIKRAENSDALVVRLYNGKVAERAHGTLRFSRPIAAASYANLLEEPTKPAVFEKNVVTVEGLTPSKFVTLLIKLA